METNSKNDPAAVDVYVATLPARENETLERLRRLIKETVPPVEARISYGTTVMFSHLDLIEIVHSNPSLTGTSRRYRPGWRSHEKRFPTLGCPRGR